MLDVYQKLKVATAPHSAVRYVRKIAPVGLSSQNVTFELSPTQSIRQSMTIHNCNIYFLFLCLVLLGPKAPCYRAHVCVRNSGFSRILRQQPETTFEQCSFDLRIPRRHGLDGNQQPETTFEQCSFDFRIPRRHDVDGNFLLRSLHVLTLRVCSTRLVSFLCLR